MTAFLDALVARLPEALQPVAKAVVPLVLWLSVAVTDLVISGPELRQGAEVAGAVVTALLVYLVRNVDKEDGQA